MISEQLTFYSSRGKAGLVTGPQELVISKHPYILVYTVMNDKVNVFTVFHGVQKKSLLQ